MKGGLQRRSLLSLLLLRVAGVHRRCHDCGSPARQRFAHYCYSPAIRYIHMRPSIIACAKRASRGTLRIVSWRKVGLPSRATKDSTIGVRHRSSHRRHGVRRAAPGNGARSQLHRSRQARRGEANAIVLGRCAGERRNAHASTPETCTSSCLIAWTCLHRTRICGSGHAKGLVHESARAICQIRRPIARCTCTCAGGSCMSQTL